MAYVLTIREKNHSWAGRSPVRTVHATNEEATAALVEYVSQNWDAEIGSDIPEDPEEMIQEYFAGVLEAYEIEAES
jgi:mono/diheme cytochrome c family protein